MSEPRPGRRRIGSTRKRGRGSPGSGERPQAKLRASPGCGARAARERGALRGRRSRSSSGGASSRGAARERAQSRPRRCRHAGREWRASRGRIRGDRVSRARRARETHAAAVRHAGSDAAGERRGGELEWGNPAAERRPFRRRRGSG